MDLNELKAMLTKTPKEQLDWAVSINDNSNKIKEPWLTHFQRMVVSAEFNTVMRDAVDNGQHMTDGIALFSKYKLKTFRGLCFAVELSVNCGGIADADAADIQAKVAAGAPITEVMGRMAKSGCSKIAAKYVADCMGRKNTIITGTGTVHLASYNLKEQYGVDDSELPPPP
jgi:hypothetical protein